MQRKLPEPQLLLLNNKNQFWMKLCKSKVQVSSFSDLVSKLYLEYLIISYLLIRNGSEGLPYCSHLDYLHNTPLSLILNDACA